MIQKNDPIVTIPHFNVSINAFFQNVHGNQSFQLLLITVIFPGYNADIVE